MVWAVIFIYLISSVTITTSHLEVCDVLVPDLTGSVGHVGPHYGQPVGHGQHVGLLGSLGFSNSGLRYGLRYRSCLQLRYLALQEGGSVFWDLLILTFY